jgi:hypothetical protein
VRRVGQPGIPEEPVGTELFDIVDLLNFDHRQWPRRGVRVAERHSATAVPGATNCVRG